MARRKHSNSNSQQDRRGKGKVKGNQKTTSCRAVKQKFEEQRKNNYFKIEPKTPNQERALYYQTNCQIVVNYGSSGTGKTFLACVHAANELTTGQIRSIVLTRPPEGVGKTIGFRKGDTNEKLAGPYQSMVEPLKQVLGSSQYEMFVKQGAIRLEPLEDVRGRSYTDSCIIVDEASNTDVKSMQTLVTRVGNGSQVIFCGDTASWQKDIKGQSGLDWIITLIKKLRREAPNYLDREDIGNLNHNIGIVEFTKDDVVRSGITKLFVKAFDAEESEP